MTPPDFIHDLIDRFRANLDSYKRGQYNETEVRREFIDPLFEALGWDVHNKQGYAEAYKEVVHEDAIRVGGKTKAPDYSFRIGGVRKFFVEAKKPSVDIKDDVAPGLPTAPLCLERQAAPEHPHRLRGVCGLRLPHASPTRATSRPQPGCSICTFTDYAARWDEIAGIFSREAILQGLVRPLCRVPGRASGARPRWTRLSGRDRALARAAGPQHRPAQPRPGPAGAQLRRAADHRPHHLPAHLRGPGHRTLRHAARACATARDIYPRLVEHFRQADARYNSGLFHFENEKGRGDAPDRSPPACRSTTKCSKRSSAASTIPTAPTSSRCCPPTSWARSTSSSWAR